jgi:hypothetical protein
MTDSLFPVPFQLFGFASSPVTPPPRKDPTFRSGTRMRTFPLSRCSVDPNANRSGWPLTAKGSSAATKKENEEEVLDEANSDSLQPHPSAPALLQGERVHYRQQEQGFSTPRTHTVTVIVNNNRRRFSLRFSHRTLAPYSTSRRSSSSSTISCSVEPSHPQARDEAARPC